MISLQKSNYKRNETQAIYLPMYLKGLDKLQSFVKQLSTTASVHLFIMFSWYS